LKTLTKREVNVLSKYFGVLDGERETIGDLNDGKRIYDCRRIC
jgi:DNA-directed RNA polymerase sigma subunit (sigma70/sigma32)